MKFCIVTYLFFSLFIPSLLSSQTGYVVYKIGFNKNVDYKTDSTLSLYKNYLQLDFQKLESAIKFLEYELIFDKDSSLFMPKESIIDNGSPEMTFAKSIEGYDKKYYHNNLSGVKFTQFNNYGHISNLENDHLQWTITDETKIIQGYKCYKAMCQLDYVPTKSTAWFTYDIPVSFGPKGMDGLPGLVLEVNISSRKIYYASMIKIPAEEEFNSTVFPIPNNILTQKQYYGDGK